MRTALCCVTALAALALSLATRHSVAADRAVTFPILLHTAPSLTHDGAAVPAEAIQEQIEVANHIFEPTGVRFELIGVREISLAHSYLESRLDRNRLLRYLHPRVINVFTVDSMRDVDDPQQWRRGVHWHHPADTSQHFVVVTSIGPRTTLAHELGHFFGNHQHSLVGGNIMSYTHGAHPCFDAMQIDRIMLHATRFLRSRQLRPVGEVVRRVASRPRRGSSQRSLPMGVAPDIGAGSSHESGAARRAG